MKKLLLITAALLLSFSSCIVRDASTPTIDYEYDDSNFYDYDDVIVSDYLWCEYSSPYYRTPEFCEEDFYGEFICCTWEVGYGCYEDWCTWYDTCEWYFDIDICY